MNGIITTLLACLICTTGVCQKVKLVTITEGAPLKTPDKKSYQFGLYFMAGFDDSASIYLNGKLINHQYIKSLSYSRDAFLPYNIQINFDKGPFLLEITKGKSKKRYYTYLKKGYFFGVFYLQNDSSILYTNKPPMNE